jgi:hypothetical protein
MNSTTLRRLALSAAAIATVLAATTVPAATFAAGCKLVHDFTYRGETRTFTAAQIGGNVINRELDATGCEIGVYNPGVVRNANIHGAQYLGVVVDGVRASVKDSRIHHIGDNPILTSDLHGMQRGEGIFYVNGARGTISGNAVRNYQKNGINARDGSRVTIKNNKVRGLGPVDFIAQNGIVVLNGTDAVVQGNRVAGHYYSGPAPDTEATGMLFMNAGTVVRLGNRVSYNQDPVYVQAD